MRLIKQSSLYFKEGNSDKIYEVDLCDAGNEKYLVNFRYGRRGSVLKEGTKTPIPVGLQEAERIFSAVEDEKLGKGYTTSETGVSQIPRPKTPAFVIEKGATAGVPSYESMIAGRDKNVVTRLYDAVNGKKPAARKSWKLTRAIWKAGEYRIKEATPYIIDLFDKGDNLHQYCCLWALVRCGDESSAPALESVFRSHPSPILTRIAGAGLLKILTGPARERHAGHYLRQLPEPMQQALQAGKIGELRDLLEERSSQLQPQYAWIESIYLLSTTDDRLREPVKDLLRGLPLKPNHFKHVRAVFKMSELLDDFEISGLLAYRFEREQEFFKHYIPGNDRDGEVYVEEIDEHIKPHRELLKKTSKLAYSQRTRWYLHKRVMRRLESLREREHTDYVWLAASILVAYNGKEDKQPGFSGRVYKWDGGYHSEEIFYPENAKDIFLHWLINDQLGTMLLGSDHLWQMREREITRRGTTRVQTVGRPASGSPRPKRRLTHRSVIGLIIWLIQSGYDLLDEWLENQRAIAKAAAERKAAQRASGVQDTRQTGTAAKNNAASNIGAQGDPLYLRLWNREPLAFIKLLTEAKMEEIHAFAFKHLSAHPSYSSIKAGLDTDQLKKLLLSDFDLPARLGYTVAFEKYTGQVAPAELVAAMLHSRHGEAREKGKEWTLAQLSTLLGDAGFVKELVFARDAEIRRWGRTLLRENIPSDNVRHAVVGKAIAAMMDMRAETPGWEPIVTDASDTLLELFLTDVELPLSVISDLLQHPVPVVQLFGLRWLRSGVKGFRPASLSKSFLFGLVQHAYLPVRETGIAFLAAMSVEQLLQYSDEIIACCVSSFGDVRRGIAGVLVPMTKQDRAFGERAASLLMPYLMRKEQYEGQHEDIGNLLCNELGDYLQGADKDMALRLLYSHYAPAQKLGITILEKYTNSSQLTIPQVIALGNHENLDVRTWSWKFYKEQIPRIHFEQEKAIRLLESKWNDTRQFAIGYFRDSFQEQDWSAEILIGIADSVKPDVEAFGRELITRYFNDSNGPLYLLQLSQHPGEKMQLFTSNYLERYAGGNDERILSLEYYFRSALTRVNKNRIARNRILNFLLHEGRRSETVARLAAAILADISATAAIGDKAACIEVLLQLRSLYALDTPLTVHNIETRA